MSLDDYLERFAAASYQRELDQEENIISSMPFFIAALGLDVAVLGSLRDSFPPSPWGAYGSFVYGCAAIVLVYVGVAFFFLWRAARVREYAYISDEEQILRYVEELARHHSEAGQGATERRVVEDVRHSLIAQYCRGAINNRRIQWDRAVARGKAVLALGGSLLVTFVLLAAILLHKVLSP